MGEWENKKIWGIIQLSQGNVNKKCGRQEFDSVCSFGMILLLPSSSYIHLCHRGSQVWHGFTEIWGIPWAEAEDEKNSIKKSNVEILDC